MRLRALIALLLLSLGSALALGPASATGSSYTVEVGPDAGAGSHATTLRSVGTISWASPRLTWACTSATTPTTPTSTVTSGVGVLDILRIPRTSFVGCTFPGGALATTTSGTWVWHGTGPATAGAEDLVAGHLENITITWANAVCRLTITGKASGTLDEHHQRLLVRETGLSGDLKISGVMGCLGLFANGDPANLTGSFDLTTPDGLVNLEQP